jgi:hypothetical protein
VRFELTRGGTVRTFDNELALRAGLLDAPAPHVSSPAMTRVMPAFGSGRTSIPGDLFGLGSDGRPWRRARDAVVTVSTVFGGRQRETGAGRWSNGFAPVGDLGGLTHLEVTTNADGRLELFGLDRRGVLWHAWQDGARGGPWIGWVKIAGDYLRDLAVARNADGRIEVFGPTLGTVDPRFQHAVQHGPNGGWDRLYALGQATGLRRCVAGTSQDGRLEVFAIDANPGLWHCWQGGLGGDWQPWSLHAAAGELGDLKDLAVANHRDGRLIVFGLSKAGEVHIVAQHAPNSGWGSWSRLGGASGFHHLTVGRHASGRLQVWGIDGGDAVWHVTQLEADGGWGTWTPWWGMRAKHLTVTANHDGRLELFAIDHRWALQHAWQLAAGGAWSDWTVIPS